MSDRSAPDRLIIERIQRLEEDIRTLRTQSQGPDPRWQLTETDDALHYLWVPTGSRGPQVGSKT
jgi:hypothetical protein